MLLNTGFIRYYACPKTINAALGDESERMLFASNIFGSMNQSVPFHLDYDPSMIQGFFIAFFVLWLLISVGIAIQYTTGWIRISRKLKKNQQYLPSNYPKKIKMRSFLESSGLTLYLIDGNESPYAFGKNAIGLPRVFIDNFSDDQLTCILAHEYSHIKNRDDLWFSLSRFFIIGLFFQPFNHRMFSKLKDLSEQRSDEDAFNHIGNRKTVAETLLAVAEVVKNGPVYSPKVALYKKQKKLLHRIERIMVGKITPVKRFSLLLAALILLTVSFFTPVVKMRDRTFNSTAFTNENGKIYKEIIFHPYGRR
jgi:beta-lactamase regulating signal transducer with metallopeptidase domain